MRGGEESEEMTDSEVHPVATPFSRKVSGELLVFLHCVARPKLLGSPRFVVYLQ